MLMLYSAFRQAKKAVTYRIQEETGGVAIEYALLAALIALVLAVGAFALGQGLDTFFGDIATWLTDNVSMPAGPGGGGTN